MELAIAFIDESVIDPVRSFLVNRSEGRILIKSNPNDPHEMYRKVYGLSMAH